MTSIVEGSGVFDRMVAVLADGGDTWRIAAHLIVDCGVHPAAAHRLAADPDTSAEQLAGFASTLTRLLHPDP